MPVTQIITANLSVGSCQPRRRRPRLSAARAPCRACRRRERARSSEPESRAEPATGAAGDAGGHSEPDTLRVSMRLAVTRRPVGQVLVMVT